MVILEEEVGDVPFHGKTACPSRVVPLEIDACEFSPIPVRRHLVVILERFEEVDCMPFADMCNAEVVDDEDKRDGSPLVSPQSRSSCTLVVPVDK
jgi:hypothetical protein